MKCLNCGNTSSRVLESRENDEGQSIRRRRQCSKCGTRFTTYERIEYPHLWVIKKEGSRQGFSRTKLAEGIYRACEKRSISSDKIEQVIDKIEREIRGLGEIEIPSNDIGEIVMKYLIELDDVAYVRFASVYRSFTDVAAFEEELDKLKARIREQTS